MHHVSRHGDFRSPRSTRFMEIIVLAGIRKRCAAVTAHNPPEPAEDGSSENYEPNPHAAAFKKLAHAKARRPSA
jgi:hypothetical protein